MQWLAAHSAATGAILAPVETSNAQLRPGASAPRHGTLLTHGGAAPAQRDLNARSCAVQAKLLPPAFPAQQRVSTATAEHRERQRVSLLRQAFSKTAMKVGHDPADHCVQDTSL